MMTGLPGRTAVFFALAFFLGATAHAQRRAAPKLDRPPPSKLLKGHTGAVTSIAFTPDGASVVTGSVDMTIRMWNAKTARSYAPIVTQQSKRSVPRQKPTTAAAMLHFWAEGHRMSKEREMHFDVPRWVKTPDWNPKAYAATVAEYVNRETEELASGYRGQVAAMAVSPDGKRIAALLPGFFLKGRSEYGIFNTEIGVYDAAKRAATDTLEVHTPAVGLPEHDFEDQAMYAHRFYVNSGDNVFAAGMGEYAGRFRGVAVRNYSYTGLGPWAGYGAGLVERGRQLRREGVNGAAGGNAFAARDTIAAEPCRSVAFSPDGNFVAAGSVLGEVKIWDKAGQLVQTLAENVDGVARLAFRPANENCTAAVKRVRLAVADGSGMIRLWTEAGRIVREWDAKVHPQRRYEFTNAPIVDLVDAMAFSPTGKTLATARSDGSVVIWSTASGSRWKDFMAHEPPSVYHAFALAYSPDGTMLATAAEDTLLKLWDARTGEQLGAIKGHSAAVEALAFSPDGRWLASASRDRTARLWDVSKYKATSVQAIAGPLEPEEEVSPAPVATEPEEIDAKAAEE